MGERDESELQGEYGTGIIGYPRSGRDPRRLFLTAGFECGRSQYLLADNRAERLHQLISTSEVKTGIKTEIKKEGSNFVGTVRLSADSQISFFNRIKVFDRETGKRILPVHYSDNYITLMPGDQQEISLEFPANLPEERIQIVVDSYNSPLP